MTQFELLEKAKKNISTHERTIESLKEEINFINRYKPKANYYNCKKNVEIDTKYIGLLQPHLDIKKIELVDVVKNKIQEHKSAINNIKLQFS